jgi:hypothetical protein
MKKRCRGGGVKKDDIKCDISERGENRVSGRGGWTLSLTEFVIKCHGLVTLIHMCKIRSV